MQRKSDSSSVSATLKSELRVCDTPDLASPSFSGGGPSLHKAASECSSTQNSDYDDDSEATPSYKERRREAHTYAEQKRRDAIKRGYESLVEIVPTCQQSDSVSSAKLSKATILQKSIDYVQFLVQHKAKQEEDLDKLRKEVMALKIMLANYEHIVKTSQNSPASSDAELPEELKFRVFQQFMDNLFLSFNSSISMNNFAELSACVFSWLEEYCKPPILKEVMHASAHHATIDYRKLYDRKLKSPHRSLRSTHSANDS